MSEPSLVSIIIPVYNTGKSCVNLLERLLDSSYKNIEIICIDDGSSDDSFELLSSFAKKHPKIILKKQKNGGPSAARNAGLKLATGKYISFIDSDDYVRQDYIEKMVAPFEDTNTVLTSCALMYNRLASGEMHNDFTTPVRGRKYNETVQEYILYLMRLDGRMYGAVTKLFKHEIIEKANLEFDTKMYLGEDTKFVLDYMAAATSHTKKDCLIKFIYDPIYVYNYGTETSTVAKSALKWENWKKSYAHLKEWSKKCRGSKIRRRRLLVLVRWKVSHALAVARANISMKEKRKYANPIEIFFATILLKFRK